MGTGYTGIVQYCDWGTGSTLSNALAVVGGEIGPGTSPVVHRQAIYGHDEMVGGLLEYSGRIDFLPLGENCGTLIEYAVRSSYTNPTLTALCFEGGNAQEYGYKHTGCKINRLTLTQSVEEALQATVEWFGTEHTTTASPSPKTDEAGPPYEWFESDITIDASRYDVQSISMTLDNSIRPGSSLDTKAADSQRKPEFLRIGSEIVTVSLVLAQPTGNTTLFNLEADSIDTDVDIVWVASNGTRDLTVTLSNFACSANPMPFVAPDGDVAWNVELEGERDNSGTISIVDSAS